ncbi:MAG: hypothetical protein UT37_C0023G0008 [Parcubacteria group bacterium GW2011_GWA2_39_18]|nr:MAG: hypothetical protein UT37_C0023G0008 [Parcubacteria group bacterium GW2011_GWA2_39_18]
MKQLLEYILKSIVNNPDQVIVDEQTESNGLITISAKVDPLDVGIMIGKNGIVARALRDLLKIKGLIEEKHYYLNLLVPPRVIDSSDKVA